MGSMDKGLSVVVTGDVNTAINKLLMYFDNTPGTYRCTIDNAETCSFNEEVYTGTSNEDLKLAVCSYDGPITVITINKASN